MMIEVRCNHCSNTAYLTRTSLHNSLLTEEEKEFLFKENGWSIDNPRKLATINNVICQECL